MKAGTIVFNLEQNKRKETIMKCIRKGDLVRRVKDQEAISLVDNKGWKFCPKEDWKAAGRPATKVGGDT